MNAPERILVRSPTWVGDAVMATPALRALRAAHSEAEITVEGRPVLGELLAGLPSYDRFLDGDLRLGVRGAQGAQGGCCHHSVAHPGG